MPEEPWELKVLPDPFAELQVLDMKEAALAPEDLPHLNQFAMDLQGVPATSAFELGPPQDQSAAKLAAQLAEGLTSCAKFGFTCWIDCNELLNAREAVPGERSPVCRRVAVTRAYSHNLHTASWKNVLSHASHYLRI